MAVNSWKKQIKIQFKIDSSLIAEFARLTGDDAPHHLDTNAAQAMGYRDVVSQGLLVLSLTGRVSSEYLSETGQSGVSYGYENIRFPTPVYPGDALTITYHPQSINEKNVISSELVATNGLEQVVMIATHLLKIFVV